MKSIYEQMGGTYHQEGDVLIPNILPPDTRTYQIGKYGLLRQKFLQENHPGFYARMLLNGTLSAHLEETEITCCQRMERMVHAMAQQEGVTEALKAADQMEWVRRMNNIHSRAEEIVLHEMVYAL